MIIVTGYFIPPKEHFQDIFFNVENETCCPYCRADFHDSCFIDDTDDELPKGAMTVLDLFIKKHFNIDISERTRFNTLAKEKKDKKYIIFPINVECKSVIKKL